MMPDSIFVSCLDIIDFDYVDVIEFKTMKALSLNYIILFLLSI